MTIPTTAWLVLRRAAGKLLPQHSVERKWDRIGVRLLLRVESMKVARLTNANAAISSTHNLLEPVEPIA